MGIRLVLCVLLLLAFGLAQSQEPTPAPPKVQHEPKAATGKSKQVPAPDQRGTDKAPLHIKLLNTGKSQSEAGDETKQKEEEASINRGTMIFTGGLLAVAIVQLLMFLWQLRLTRDAVKAAERSAKAITDAEAPYLLPENFGADGFFVPVGMDLTGLRPRITYSFKNHGKTPAIITRFRDFTLFTNELPKHPNFTEEWSARAPQYIPIGVGETGGQIYAQIPPGASREDVLEVTYKSTGKLPRLSQHSLYVIGEVEYVDIFNVVRTQGYCLLVMVIFPGDEDEHGNLGPDKVFAWRAGGKEYNQRREVEKEAHL